MNSRLPHFGVLVDALRDCLEKVASEGENVTSYTFPSERTVRTISAGQPVKERTWDEYASRLLDSLIGGSLFPLDGNDRSNLTKVFHGYRSSYEQLGDFLTHLPGSAKIIRRGVLRLGFLDAGIRYAALCIWRGTPPPEGRPLWGFRDGANLFWKQALEKRFPGVPLVDSSKPDGDCAQCLKITRSKMTRCCYENDFPGVSILRRVFPTTNELAGALQHYAAFDMICRLAAEFGWIEVEFWVEKMTRLASWLYSVLSPPASALSAEKRLKMVKRAFIGGIDDKFIKEVLRGKLGDHIPTGFRADLLTLAEGDTISAIRTYCEFCDYMGEAPAAGACWEKAFDDFQIELEEFRATGKFAVEKTPSQRLQLARLLLRAERKGDHALEERILREIIRLHPLDTDAHQLLAQCFHEQGKLEEAWREFEIAAQLDPSSALPLFSLADSKSEAGRHEEALSTVERIPASGIGEGSRDFLFGLCLLRSGRHGDAVQLLEAAFNAGWEPGSSAALISHAHLKILRLQPKSRLKVHKWKKLAHHHGVKVQEAVKAHGIT